jgi:hypothetical protein
MLWLLLCQVLKCTRTHWSSALADRPDLRSAHIHTAMQRFAVFLKPDGSTLIIFDTSGGYSSCVLPKGVTTKK